MKKAFLKFALLIVAASLVLISCKKNDTNPDVNDEEIQAANASDQNMFSQETDLALEDASEVVSGSSANAKIAAGGTVITNATIDSTTTPGTYVITYNGLSSDGKRNRTGKVTAKIGPTATSKWSDAGSYLTLTFTDLKISRDAGSKTITINGTKIIKNLSGGNKKTLKAGAVNGHLEYKVRGNLNVSFDNGTVKNWQIARNKVVTKTDTDRYTFTVKGDSTYNGTPNAETWGTNRNGNSFVEEISTPLVFDSGCNWNGSSGVYMHHLNLKSFTVTLGVNSDGTAHSGTDCAYGFKLAWQGMAGTQKTKIIGY